VKPLNRGELESGLQAIRNSPRDGGVLDMIVCRTHVNLRETPEAGDLTPAEGLVGDNWSTRARAADPTGGVSPDSQLTIMNTSLISLLAGEREQWKHAGDQMILNMDLSVDNLPPGTRLRIGDAVIEITAKPHTGCSKFARRFGQEALEFVNSPEGKRLRLRGVYAKVVTSGRIRVGDVVSKTQPDIALSR
jgi:hypothetical protein